MFAMPLVTMLDGLFKYFMWCLIKVGVTNLQVIDLTSLLLIFVMFLLFKLIVVACSLFTISLNDVAVFHASH